MSCDHLCFVRFRRKKKCIRFMEEGGVYSDDDDDNNNAHGSSGNASERDVTSPPASPTSQANGIASTLPPLPPLMTSSLGHDPGFNPLTSVAGASLSLPPPPPLHHMYGPGMPFGLPPAGGAPPLNPFNLYGSAPGSKSHPLHHERRSSVNGVAAADRNSTSAKSPAAAATVKQEPSGDASGFLKSESTSSAALKSEAANSSVNSLAPMPLTIMT